MGGFRLNLKNATAILTAIGLLAGAGSLRAYQKVRVGTPLYEKLKEEIDFRKFIEETREGEDVSGLEQAVQKDMVIPERQAESNKPYSNFKSEDPLARIVFDKKYDSVVDSLTSDEVIKSYIKNGRKITITKRSDTRIRLNGAYKHKKNHFDAYQKISEEMPGLKKYALLPLVTIALEARESAGNCEAKSHANAKGCMQYKPKTAREDGLIVKSLIDESKDPEKAIPASMGRIVDFMNRYSSLETALAMYNAGETRVKDVMAKAGSDNFMAYKKYLSEETQRYVPEIIAMARVLTSPINYGIIIKQKNNQIACDRKHEIRQGDTLYKIMRKHGVPKDDVKHCNPAVLNLTELPVGYHLKIPRRG